MSASPFLAESSVVQLHLLAAIVAFALGAYVLFRPKGTPIHKLLGRVWMALMATIALSSLLIPASILPFAAGFSIIHVLSLWTLVSVCVAIWAARTGRIRQHRIWVGALYGGALIGAGAGALAPGRLISEIFGYG